MGQRTPVYLDDDLHTAAKASGVPLAEFVRCGLATSTAPRGSPGSGRSSPRHPGRRRAEPRRPVRRPRMLPARHPQIRVRQLPLCTACAAALIGETCQRELPPGRSQGPPAPQERPTATRPPRQANPAERSRTISPAGGSDLRRHLAGGSWVDALGLGQVGLRAGLRETAGGGNGLSQARRIPIEVPEGAERGGQPAGKPAAGLRGRHSNHLHLCWSLRLAPIVPAHHGPPVKPRLRGWPAGN